MADHLSALDHHAKAKTALEKGDSKKAAHHLGHAMRALRNTAPTVEAKSDTGYMTRIRKGLKK